MIVIHVTSHRVLHCVFHCVFHCLASFSLVQLSKARVSQSLGPAMIPAAGEADALTGPGERWGGDTDQHAEAETNASWMTLISLMTCLECVQK